MHARYLLSCQRIVFLVILSFFTWRRDHLLPLLEERGFEAVPGVERVRLVPGHQLLHGLQDDTQLQREGVKHQSGGCDDSLKHAAELNLTLR